MRRLGICRGCGRTTQLHLKLHLCEGTWDPYPNPRIGDSLEPRPNSCLASFLRWTQAQPVLVDLWLEAGGLETSEQKAADEAHVARTQRLTSLIKSVFGEILPAAMSIAGEAVEQAEPRVTKKVTKVLDGEKDPT